MVTLGIDGLVSGLDTSSLIDKLMSVEKAPQTLLKTKQTTASTLVSALQGLNTRLASLITASTAAAKDSSWSAYAATVTGGTASGASGATTSPAATATAGGAATAGEVTFTVDAVAASQVSLSRTFTDLADLLGDPPAALTLTRADGTSTALTVTGDRPADLVAAINRADAGVTATLVRTGDGQRLQLTGTSTGATAGFALHLGDAAAVAAGTATDLTPTTVRSAADSVLTLWPGTGSAQQVRSASTTFDGLLTGVDVTVARAGADPVTVSVARDGTALGRLTTDLVSGLAATLSTIAAGTKTSTTTGSDGRAVVSGGVLSGTSMVRFLADDLRRAVSLPVDGRSPAAIGLKLGSDGAVTLDAAALQTALAEDPAAVQRMVTGIAARVAEVATRAGDARTGTVTQVITTQQGLVRDLADRIADWDDRLALRRTGLERTYSALETTLSALQSQSSWLSAQLESLISSGGSQ